MGRAEWVRGTAEKGRGGTGQSRGGSPDSEQECRGLRAAAAAADSRGGGGRRRGRQRPAVESRSARQAGRTERGGPKTKRVAQTGKWPRSPPSASLSLEKTGLKGSPGTSGPPHSPTADPPLLPSRNTSNPYPFSSPQPASCVDFVKVSHPVHPPPHPISSLLMTREIMVNCL